MATRMRRCFPLFLPPPVLKFSSLPSLLSLSAFVINEAIQARTVRLVIQEEGSSGPPTSIVVSRHEALAKAKEAGLDLVLGKEGSEEREEKAEEGGKGEALTVSYEVHFFQLRDMPAAALTIC